jgi:hypothetical protein
VGVVEAGQSAIEQGPAGLIAQSLVVEHEIPDLIGKLCTLPLALPAASLVALGFGCHRAHGPDRVGRCTEFVCCNMGHGYRLTRGVSRFPRGAGYLSGCGVCGKGRRASLSHRDFTPHPSACLFDRLAGTVVSGLRLLEEVKYMLRAIGRPRRKKPMVSSQ